jgi:hypothetical protein
VDDAPILKTLPVGGAEIVKAGWLRELPDVAGKGVVWRS